MDSSEGCECSVAGALVRRSDRRPAGSWIREAWLADEVLQLVAAEYEALTGERHPTVVALESGREAAAFVYELPDVLGDRLREQGCPPHVRWRLTADDGLELV